jgi:hypothetical protein
MGYQPRRSPGALLAALYGPQIRPVRSPDRESFHLHMARLAYIEGSISVEEFEISVAHVLKGGTLDKDGRAPFSSMALYAQRHMSPEQAALYQP